MMTADLRLDRARSTPWLVWCATLASVAIVTADHWDISWHRSIGRDTFFAPPHVLLYLASCLACTASGYAILKQSFFAPASERAGLTRIWGLHGPFGAFVAAWGGIAMLTAGPLDNWWHGAYGLDIVLQSPPHMLIFTGSIAVVAGALLLAVAQANREEKASPVATALILLAGSAELILVLCCFFEDTFDYQMHSAHFYGVVAFAVPGLLSAVACASGLRFGATLVAGAYSAFLLLLIGILPLFSAEPRLGPVLHPITHFTPPPFPLLLVPAAITLDLVRARWAKRSLWLQASLAGTCFLAVFIALEWPFAIFLHTAKADNRVFVANAFAYFQGDSSPAVRRIFWPQHTPLVDLWLGLAVAWAIAMLTSSAGLFTGRWLRQLRR